MKHCPILKNNITPIWSHPLNPKVQAYAQNQNSTLSWLFGPQDTNLISGCRRLNLTLQKSVYHTPSRAR